MSVVDSVLKLITKDPKDPDAPKPPVGSRSEREAKLKDKAGMVISVFALLLAVNAWYGGKLSSIVLNNTLGANNNAAMINVIFILRSRIFSFVYHTTLATLLL